MSFWGKRCFGFQPDGKHSFTSLESYGDKDSYHYQLVKDEVLARKITRYAEKAFTVCITMIMPSSMSVLRQGAAILILSMLTQTPHLVQVWGCR